MKNKGSLSFWLILLLGVTLSLIAFILGVGFSLYSHINEGLPSIESLKNYRPPIVTTLYAADGSPVAEFYHERRYIVPIKEIPPHVVKAFLAVEDSRFYEHKGIDLWSVLRAAFVNLRAGTIVQGGSTITQQVVKSLLLTPERTWQRKIKEAILAYKIDNFLTKDEILQLYLNQVYFGAGAYGVEAAARTFFAKHVQDLTIAEAAMIAGLPKAPSRFNPHDNMEEARKRQLYVIQRMEEEHFISPPEAEKARNEAVKISGRQGKALKEMNHFIEEVRRRLIEKYGEKVFYEEGLQIYTTLDLRAQELAQRSLLQGLQEYEKRHGFRGYSKTIPKGQWETFIGDLKEHQPNPKEGNLLTALVVATDDKKKGFLLSLGNKTLYLYQDGWSWTRRSYTSMKNIIPPGSVVKVYLEESDRLRLANSLEVEGAFMLADMKSGDVLALVGGKDFGSSQFNRATQAKRQPGSAFKPLVYATAIDRGFTEITTVVDSPVSYKSAGNRIWTPGNYDNTFLGPIILRKALALSRNVVAVKLMNAVGVDNVIEMARKLGIESPLSRSLSLALGASGLPLLELTQAYAVFGNNGQLTPFRFVSRVMDRDGRIFDEFPTNPRQVLSPDTAYIMTDMLMAVVNEGTGKTASSLGRPVAGKTGTSNEFRDAWFIGYTPDFIAGVWVGYDDNSKSLGSGEAGGKVACPIWTNFMKEWLQDKPVTSFTPPPTIVFEKVNLGGPDPENQKLAYLPFKPDTLSSRHHALEQEGTEEDGNADLYESIPEEAQEERSIYKSGLF